MPEFHYLLTMTIPEPPSAFNPPPFLRSASPGARAGLRLLRHVIGYAAWLYGFRLMVITLLTYVLMSERGKLQDVADTYVALELPLLGLASALFVMGLRAWPSAGWGGTDEAFFGKSWPKSWVKTFWPGFWRGTCLGTALVVGLWVAGAYRNEGWLAKTTDEDVLPLLQWLLRWVALGVWIAAEEWFFRVRCLNMLLGRTQPWIAIGIVSLAFTAFKAFQFPLGWMHSLTWFLASVVLSLRAFQRFHFWNGVGLWFGMLFVIHSVFGLTILGHEGFGLFFMRIEDVPQSQARFVNALTGGFGGPLSSALLQGLMALEALRWIRSARRFLWLSPRGPLK